MWLVSDVTREAKYLLHMIAAASPTGKHMTLVYSNGAPAYADAYDAVICKFFLSSTPHNLGSRSRHMHSRQSILLGMHFSMS